MKSESHIFYILLTLCTSALAVGEVTQYHVDAMNDMFTLTGWRIMREHDGFVIVVQGTEEGTADSILSAKDILETDDEDGRIVTAENASTKIRQVHQLLSCQYASNLRVCLHYNVAALLRCKTMKRLSQRPECICIFRNMIRKMDEMAVRMQATLLCIHQEFPITTYNKVVSETIGNFKRFYDTLFFESTSTDKGYHDSIIKAYSTNMDTALNSLVKFYNDFCGPNKDDSLFSITVSIQELDDIHRKNPIKVISNIKERLDIVVRINVEDYETASVGFEYDTEEKKSHLSFNDPNQP